jgi:hypothetical protein
VEDFNGEIWRFNIPIGRFNTDTVVFVVEWEISKARYGGSTSVKGDSMQRQWYSLSSRGFQLRDMEVQHL